MSAPGGPGLGAPFDAGGVRWWAPAGADTASLRDLLEHALAQLADGRARRLKGGRRKALYALDLDGDGEPEYLLKHNRYAGADRIGRRLRGSKARRELRLATALAARGIATPVPRAAGERRAWGCLDACYLLVTRLPGVEDLAAAARRPLPARERRELARGLGLLVRELHAAGLLQDDLAPNNVLVQPGVPPRLLPIDFERARLAHGPVSRADGLHMLAKLERRFPPDVGTSLRLRCLRAYTGGDAAAARAWWRELGAYAPRLARADWRRWRRTATREGRRFVPVARGDWHGWTRREAPLEAILARAQTLAPDGAVRVESADATWLVAYPPGDTARGADRWASAQLLFERARLAPRPLAWLDGPQVSVLALAGPAAARAAPPSAEPHAPATRARRVLERRLAALGRCEPLPERCLAFERDSRGTLRALLLDPSRWTPA